MKLENSQKTVFLNFYWSRYKYLKSGWYPEVVFLTVVFLNSTDLAVVIPNSTVKRDSFYPLF